MKKTISNKPFSISNLIKTNTFLRWLSRLLALAAFVGFVVVVIAYARGYRLDFREGSVSSTGILAINSIPKPAKIYINGELKGVTDQNVPLSPGRYTVEIKLDGHTSWRKDIILKGELVESLTALLFPINPSLTPFTNIGVGAVMPVGQGDKVLLFSQNEDLEKDGVYLFDQPKAPFSFLPPLKLLTLKKNFSPSVNFLFAKVSISPDLKQAILDFPQLDSESTQTLSYLISLEDEDSVPFDVTLSKEALLTAWEQEEQEEISKILETFPKDIKKVASESFDIISFSPDKTKILYRAKLPVNLPKNPNKPIIGINQTPEERLTQQGKTYIYDKKEDQNFPFVPQEGTLIPTDDLKNTVLWYPDSRHMVIKEKDQIVVVDYDNTNKRNVYSGPFEKNFLGITSDGKLLILTNLNSLLNKYPDLYAVGIR